MRAWLRDVCATPEISLLCSDLTLMTHPEPPPSTVDALWACSSSQAAKGVNAVWCVEHAPHKLIPSVGLPYGDPGLAP